MKPNRAPDDPSSRRNRTSPTRYGEDHSAARQGALQVRYYAALRRLRSNPSEAHHIRFAQPRALGRKVSDEYTVPVCRLDHRELHRYGDEASWWAAIGIDLLPIAPELWWRSRLPHTSEAPRLEI